jgi:predicted site-specific integrase-resolvase
MFLIEACGFDLVNPLVLKECGSGLNAKRAKVQRLIRMVMGDEVRNVYVTYRDCLTRFGFEYLETAFAAHGTNIVVVKDADDEKSVERELVEDLMSLMASFSGKLYGLRSHKNNQSSEKSEK